MKKRLMNIVMWDHFSQVLWVLSTVPNFISWWHGKASMFGMLISGFNLGMAAGWGYYLAQRRRTDMWMKRALRPAPDFEEALKEAGSLVEARLQSAHINADLN